jgi:hypothetical protein
LSAVAIAAPMPRVPPVTSAVRAMAELRLPVETIMVFLTRLLF